MNKVPTRNPESRTTHYTPRTTEIKVVKILQELVESEPKLILNVKGKYVQTYLYKQQNYR